MYWSPVTITLLLSYSKDFVLNKNILFLLYFPDRFPFTSGALTLIVSVFHPLDARLKRTPAFLWDFPSRMWLLHPRTATSTSLESSRRSVLLWTALQGSGMQNGRLLPFLGQPRFVNKNKDLRKRQEINVYNKLKVRNVQILGFWDLFRTRGMLKHGPEWC